MRHFHSRRARAITANSALLRFLPVSVAAGLAYAAFLSFAPPQMDDDTEQKLVAAAAPQVIVPKPDSIATAVSSSGMREAFTTQPPSPSYAFDSEQKSPSTDVRAPLLPVQKKVAAITQRIEGALNASENFLQTHRILAVGKGDTLMNLLVRNHVPRGEADAAIRALSKVYDPRDLNPGGRITVFFHQDPTIADPQFAGLSIQKDVVSTVRVSRNEGGIYVAGQVDKELHTATKAFGGKIDSSLFESANAAGVPDSVILDLIKMYSFGVDFQRDFQGGDRFEVMYRQPVTDDGDSVPGREEIIYAKLILSGKAMPLYRYQDQAGDADYYDAAGRGAKKPLMKTPIDGARMSSGFGMRRHPIMGYSKMHKGIDFAAPRGTPIYAAGEGVIKKIGTVRGYGRYVKIQHRSGVETAYAHMNAFKAGLRTGSRVKQGQVIGYVGSSGNSTGPHLHYEIMLSGRQVNPAAVKLAGGKALRGRDLKDFKRVAGAADRVFARLGKPEALADASKATGKSTR